MQEDAQKTIKQRMREKFAEVEQKLMDALQEYVDNLPDDGYDHFEPIHSFLNRAERERYGR